MTVLLLKGDEIHDIEKGTDFSDVITFSLNDCSVTELPGWVLQIENLNILSIENCNSLTHLPEDLGSLTNLEKIRIKHCSTIRELPDSVGDLIGLREIILMESGFTGLPDSVDGLVNLEKLLILDCAEFEYLPDKICEIRGGKRYITREFIINHTKLSKIPHRITEIRGLRTLSLHSNQISQIPYHIFDGVCHGDSYLRNIGLSHNVGSLQEDFGRNIDVKKVCENLEDDMWKHGADVEFGDEEAIPLVINLFKYCGDAVYPPEDYEDQYWEHGFPDPISPTDIY